MRIQKNRLSISLSLAAIAACFAPFNARAINLAEEMLSVKRKSPPGAISFEDSFELFVTYDKDETPVVAVGASPTLGNPYTFTGYTIKSVRGTYTNPGGEIYNIPNWRPTPAGSVQRNPSPGEPSGIDTIDDFPSTPVTYQSYWYLGALDDASNKYPHDLTSHNVTDNLYNPDGGFAEGDLAPGRINGRITYGGLQFFVDYGEDYALDSYPNRYMPYQFFFLENPVAGDDYAGCPGDCGVARILVPGPLPLFGVVSAFGLSRQLRRRIRMSAARERNHSPRV
jgi:hypothetical protein